MCLFKVYVAQTCGHRESPIKLEACPYDHQWWLLFSQSTPINSAAMEQLRTQCQAVTVTKRAKKHDYCYKCDDIMRQTLIIHKQVIRARRLARIAKKEADEAEEAEEARRVAAEKNIDPSLRFAV
jgi:hypothetical protein